LTHGNTVKITATVYAWNTGSSDALDLYYAANASSPTWVFIGTIVPPAGGVQSLSATYTLPTGSMQAVRANFRYLGSASACNAGSYNDHDDLVFAVQ
jgi:leucyl aminopeptidase